MKKHPKTPFGHNAQYMYIDLLNLSDISVGWFGHGKTFKLPCIHFKYLFVLFPLWSYTQTIFFFWSYCNTDFLRKIFVLRFVLMNVSRIYNSFHQLWFFPIVLESNFLMHNIFNHLRRTIILILILFF